MINTFYNQSFPKLEVDSQFILREQEIKDTQNFFAYYGDPDVGQYILADKPRTLTEASTEINYCRSLFHYKKGIYWTLAHKESDEMIGAIGIYINNQHHRGEICYDLAHQYWNQGIMTRALQKVISFCFNQIGLIRLEALTVKENISSIAVLTKVGFHLEATLTKYRNYKDQFHNVEMYALIAPHTELSLPSFVLKLEKHQSTI